MEKLEVKHIAPYLPYKLQTDIGELVSIQSECRIVDTSFVKYELSGEFPKYEAGLISKMKPILRPISDLALEHCFHPEWEFIFQEYEDEYYATDTKIINKFSSDSDPELFHFPIVQLLFEHHFDVFGLIYKGLAININSLGK